MVLSIAIIVPLPHGANGVMGQRGRLEPVISVIEQVGLRRCLFKVVWWESVELGRAMRNDLEIATTLCKKDFSKQFL